MLPYRFGTHSGWLEACYDLGTPVLAPDCGFYAEQRPVPALRLDGPTRRGDADRGRARRPHAPTATVPTWRADPEERRRERHEIAARPRAGVSPRCWPRRSGVRVHVVVLAASSTRSREPFAGGLESLTWHLVARPARTAAST